MRFQSGTIQGWKVKTNVKHAGTRRGFMIGPRAEISVFADELGLKDSADMPRGRQALAYEQSPMRVVPPMMSFAPRMLFAVDWQTFHLQIGASDIGGLDCSRVGKGTSRRN